MEECWGGGTPPHRCTQRLSRVFKWGHTNACARAHTHTHGSLVSDGTLACDSVRPLRGLLGGGGFDALKMFYVPGIFACMQMLRFIKMRHLAGRSGLFSFYFLLHEINIVPGSRSGAALKGKQMSSFFKPPSRQCTIGWINYTKTNTPPATDRWTLQMANNIL